MFKKVVERIDIALEEKPFFVFLSISGGVSTSMGLLLFLLHFTMGTVFIIGGIALLLLSILILLR
jgi:ABC-type proline/glycine betaine transport system ATPase subunit